MFKAIYHLFFGKPINLYSPYTLDETYEQLENASKRAKHKPSPWRRIRGFITRQHRHFLLVTLEAIDSHAYGFQAHRDVSGGIRISVRGEVKDDESDVMVTGIVRVNIFTLIMLLLWLVLLIVILVVTIRTPFRVIPLFYTLILSVYILSIKVSQNRMHNTIHAILGKSKKKNSESEK